MKKKKVKYIKKNYIQTKGYLIMMMLKKIYKIYKLKI